MHKILLTFTFIIIFYTQSTNTLLQANNNLKKIDRESISFTPPSLSVVSLKEEIPSLKVYEEGSDYVKISWEKNNLVLVYRIYYKANENTYSLFRELSGNLDNATVDNLSPSTDYTIKLVSVDQFFSENTETIAYATTQNNDYTLIEVASDKKVVKMIEQEDLEYKDTQQISLKSSKVGEKVDIKITEEENKAITTITILDDKEESSSSLVINSNNFDNTDMKITEDALLYKISSQQSIINVKVSNDGQISADIITDEKNADKVFILPTYPQGSRVDMSIKDGDIIFDATIEFTSELGSIQF